MATEIDESGVPGGLVAGRLQMQPVALAGADVTLRAPVPDAPA
jgi:hypothetical protein